MDSEGVMLHPNQLHIKKVANTAYVMWYIK